MFQTLQTVFQCGTVLLIAFFICLSLPQSRLREIVMPFVAWSVTALSALYVVSPLDILPDVIPVIGWADDVLAIGVGLFSAIAALTAGRKAKQLN